VGYADKDVFVPALDILEPLHIVAGPRIRKPDYANFHAVLYKHSLVLVVKLLEDSGGIKNSKRLLREESIVPVHAIMVSGSAVNRARIIRVMLGGSTNKLVGVSPRSFDMEEIPAVEDGQSPYFFRYVSNLREFVEDSLSPIIYARTRTPIRHMYVGAPN